MTGFRHRDSTHRGPALPEERLRCGETVSEFDVSTFLQIVGAGEQRAARIDE